jgi:hypothetical protein
MLGIVYTIMKKKSSDWYVPPELGLFLIIPIIAILAGMLLPLLARFKSGDIVGIYYAAIGVGAVGAVLLFFARLPLYRQRQFWTFGPGHLSGIHRKLYWLAYMLIAVSGLLLLLIWLRLR